jgi:uncharacterized protein (TIGR03000 family)
MFRPLLLLFALFALVVPGWTGAQADPPAYGPYGQTPGAYDDDGPTRMTPPSTGGGDAEPYSSYGYTPGAYDYSGPAYSSGYRSSYYYAPSFTEGGLNFRAPPPDRKVHLVMRLPAEAKVWFNGKEVPGKGAFRRFVSPALNEDGAYAYNLRVSWKDGKKTVEKTRRVIVHPGDHLAMNFNLPSPATSTR